MKNKIITGLILVFSINVFGYGTQSQGYGILPGTMQTANVTYAGTNYCIRITNTHASRIHFVHLNSQTEFNSLLAHKPADLTLSACGGGGGGGGGSTGGGIEDFQAQ